MSRRKNVSTLSHDHHLREIERWRAPVRPSPAIGGREPVLLLGARTLGIASRQVSHGGEGGAAWDEPSEDDKKRLDEAYRSGEF